MPSRRSVAWYREEARVMYHDEGAVEVEEEAEVELVEEGDNGAWVEARVWVPDEESWELEEVVEEMRDGEV